MFNNNKHAVHFRCDYYMYYVLAVSQPILVADRHAAGNIRVQTLFFLSKLLNPTYTWLANKLLP